MATKMTYEFENGSGVLNVLEGPAMGQYKFTWANKIENGALVVGTVSVKVGGQLKHVRLTAPLSSLPGLEEKMRASRDAALAADQTAYNSAERVSARIVDQKMREAGFRG
jgi:flagellar motor switch protein FliM